MGNIAHLSVSFLICVLPFFLHETPILYRGHILRRGWDGAGYDYNMIIT